MSNPLVRISLPDHSVIDDNLARELERALGPSAELDDVNEPHVMSFPLAHELVASPDSTRHLISQSVATRLTIAFA
jgi:hypothetical protein